MACAFSWGGRCFGIADHHHNIQPGCLGGAPSSSLGLGAGSTPAGPPPPPQVKGAEGEDRVVITFNGKFLPYVEQRVEDNVAQRGKQQQ